MATKTVNRATGVGEKWKQYASGSLQDLAADSPDGATCARMIVMLAAGDLTHCHDAYNNDVPLTGLPAGYQHIASVQKAHGSVGFIAYW